MPRNMIQRHNRLIRNTIPPAFAIVFFFLLPLYVAIDQVEKSRTLFAPASLVHHLKLPENTSAIKYFAVYGYDLSSIRRGLADVPRLYLDRLPRELPRMQDIDERKKLFIATMLPLILKANEQILADRKKLISLIRRMESGLDLRMSEWFWIRRKLKQYRMKEENLYRLLCRMNAIPPSLALTQAAIESGWGTSRFAQKGNALYGQWTFGNDDGMVPRRREDGKNHKIKRFPYLIQAVQGYMRNLNTHPAYARFREVRAREAQNGHIRVMPLVETLDKYSERGRDYVETLKTIIRVNRLQDFDRVSLKPQ